MFCKNCGAEIPENEMFCENCKKTVYNCNNAFSKDVSLDDAMLLTAEDENKSEPHVHHYQSLKDNEISDVPKEDEGVLTGFVDQAEPIQNSPSVQVLPVQSVPVKTIPAVPVQPVNAVPVTSIPVTVPVYSPIVYKPVYVGDDYMAVLPKEGGAKLVSVLKNLSCSPLMIIAVVALTVNIVFSFLALINTIDVSGTIFNQTELVLDLYFFSFDVMTLSDVVNIVLWCIAGIVGITSLIMLIGMWYTVIQGFFKGTKFSTVGLSLVKGVQVAYIVFISIALLPILILTVSVLGIEAAAGDIFGSGRSVTVLCLMAYAILSIIFYSCANGSISAVKRSVKFRDAFGTSSGFVAVSSFLVSIINVFYVVFMIKNGFVETLFSEIYSDSGFEIINIDGFSTANVMMIISTVAAIVAGICFGVVIFVHKYKLNKIINESCQSQYVN